MTNALLWLIALGLLILHFDLRRIARNQRNSQLRSEVFYAQIKAALEKLRRSQ